MNGIFSYLKSYVILFLVLTILLEMVPKAGMQKYIRFSLDCSIRFWGGWERVTLFWKK